MCLPPTRAVWLDSAVLADLLLPGAAAEWWAQLLMATIGREDLGRRHLRPCLGRPTHIHTRPSCDDVWGASRARSEDLLASMWGCGMSLASMVQALYLVNRGTSARSVQRSPTL